jgi:enterochelin esterase family protein
MNNIMHYSNHFFGHRRIQNIFLFIVTTLFIMHQPVVNGDQLRSHLACPEEHQEFIPEKPLYQCETPLDVIYNTDRRLEIAKELSARYKNNLILDNRRGTYIRGSDTRSNEDAPQGKIYEYTWNASQVYPGTHRSYWVYVPAQYDGFSHAALMVFQDGQRFMNPDIAPTIAIFDNLIHSGDMPVTIGVFINPGTRPGIKEPDSIPMQQRQIEYDTQNDDYARLLLTEILREVETKYRISSNAKMRAIAGISSGAMAAWKVAWAYPEEFGKVMSFVGSYTNILGGHNHAFEVRRTPRKDIRVFLQSGSNDLQLEFGDWPLANKTMASALAFAGYDYRFVFGDGGHDLKHGAAIMSESLIWLWRDH